MFLEGKIKTYNEERGFGFIEIAGESKDLFFHIKDFPNKNVPPKVGESLKFLKVQDAGKFKADHIVRLDISYQKTPSKIVSQHNDLQIERAVPYRQPKNSVLSKLITGIGLIIIVILAVLVYGKYQNYKIQKQQQLEHLMQEQKRLVSEQRAALGNLPEQGLSEQGRKNLEVSTNTPIRSTASSTSVSSPYQCDGRTHCSQMRSYDEAVFFLRNCPGTQMDGNHDGVPCERQFKEEISKRHLFR
ncbi:MULTISPECIES: cold shock domain-containing protein [Acinetobacter]|uniref:cold shock domain-containing protein n=1 Tax=Acinetobacter TaxID=469 RepID=UPI00044B0992|nr:MULTISPECIES: cold shock domain-containing protein [Acinetobacter]EXA68244.1 'Cold-shock' DNA-binding domain protein [Acinetobacter baumannii 348935]UNW07486.1 cold shock domain-containing protein [Acinetobacter variabilis]WPC34248.1 cold shock domain-containing protein [Acinetobacter sp. YWS30-1]